MFSTINWTHRSPRRTLSGWDSLLPLFFRTKDTKQRKLQGKIVFMSLFCKKARQSFLIWLDMGLDLFAPYLHKICVCRGPSNLFERIRIFLSFTCWCIQIEFFAQMEKRETLNWVFDGWNEGKKVNTFLSITSSWYLFAPSLRMATQFSWLMTWIEKQRIW